MANKQTKTTRTTVEDITTAWVIEHKAVFLVGLVLLFVCGFFTGCNAMETQLHHAGLW